MGKVLFISCTPVARYMIEEIKTNFKIKNVEIVGIVNLNSERAVSKANYDSYLDLASKHSIDLHYCDNVNDKITMDFISEKTPDIIIQSGWSQKFSNELLSLAKYCCIGEHPAPLPRGRGAACVNWAIISGETEWGDSFFRMMERYDEGELFAQKEFTIELHDDVKTVYDKVCESSRLIIRENIEDWTSGKLKGYYQDDSKATYFKRRTPKDGYFDFFEDSKTVYNKIRGQARPYPGAFFLYGKSEDLRKVTVWKAKLGNPSNDSVGTVISNKVMGEIEVVCGDNKSIILSRVQEEESPEMWAYDWYKDLELILNYRK